MKIRLHEIELGSANVQQSAAFFQTVLGLTPTVQQENLTVFEAGLPGLDFNVSGHLAKGLVAISFLTNDLEEAQRLLSEKGIAYEGPTDSHLGMSSLCFNSPDGCVIKINAPGSASPVWLKA